MPEAPQRNLPLGSDHTGDPAAPTNCPGQNGRKHSAHSEKRGAQIIRALVDRCTDCDVCRHLMDDACLMFPELYRLWDREQGGGGAICESELRELAERCCFCALCPCPEIRAAILEAKGKWTAGEGVPLAVRLLADPDRILRLCGSLPGLANRLMAHGPTSRLLKQSLGIHPARRLPSFPAESFERWVRRWGLDRKPSASPGRRALYFAGCSGRRLFPAVPRAAVSLLQAGGVSVWVPKQGCCGMPLLLEGDRSGALARAERNLAQLASAVSEGFEIVCSCSTCSYLLRVLQSQWIPPPPNASSLPALRASPYGLLQGEDFFAPLPADRRLEVARHTHDLGTYLLTLKMEGALNLPHAPPAAVRLAYFVPCHQREQGIGRPYADLLRGIGGVTVDTIDGSFFCCGMGGILGFKQGFHEDSLRLGQPLMDRIRASEPDCIVTDCLSCRLQFQQALPYTVRHPLELLCLHLPSQRRN